MKFRHNVKHFWWALTNWLKGLAFSPVARCRECDHTVYKADRRTVGCRYCR